jgi:quercetin dioxygenase-like cupin family protein
MAIAHAVSGEVVDLLTPGVGNNTPEKTLALFKAKDLEVMRVVLAAGKRVPDHSVPGSITVQCLEGQVELSMPGHTATLSAGQFAYVGGGVSHALHALQDCDLLVTIAIAAGSGTSTTS